MDLAPRISVEPIDSMPRAGKDRPVRSLSETKHVMGFKPDVLLRPGQATIGADEDAAPGLVVDQADVDRSWMLYILDIRRDLPRGEAVVRLRKVVAAVVRDEHAAAIRREHDAIRICGADVDVVHDHLRPGHPNPGLA